jgi:hypothetical protein
VVSEADFGDPIAWRLLEAHTPVHAVDGVSVGVVRRVMALDSEDIFDGIVVHTHDGDRFVPGERVSAIRERGVTLALDQAEVAALQPPSPGPAAMAVDPDTVAGRGRRSLKDLAGDAWNRLNGR